MQKTRVPRPPRKAKSTTKGAKRVKTAPSAALVAVPARARGFTAHDVATRLVLRSTLRLALREGDVAAAGRVVARLRIDGAGIAAAELEAARLARAERAALHANADEIVPLPAGRARSPRRRTLAARAVAAAAALCALAFVPAALTPSAAQDAAPAVAPVPVLAQASLESRGRSTATLPPVAIASPDPTPTAAPAPSPSLAPVATAAPVAHISTPLAAPVARAGVPGGIAGGVPGGVVGGVPGGVLGGTGNVKPVAIPTPLPAAALVPGSVAKGQNRLTLMVVDAASGQPLPGVCVILGTGSCGPSKPQTNALGLWWLEYPSGSAPLWDVTLVDPRYRALTQRIAAVAPDQMVEIRLRPR